MTRGSILEYKEAVRWRYLKAGKKEKGRILGEFIQVTRYHRKAAIRLLRRYGPQRQRSRRGRRRRYGDEVLDALREVWEAQRPVVFQAAQALSWRAGEGDAAAVLSSQQRKEEIRCPRDR